jgi:basic membrane protein A and related proteins
MRQAGSLRLTGLLIGLIVILVLAALPIGEGSPPLKIAMVFPGIVTDHSWNQDGFEGLKLIEKDLGAKTAYVERIAQPDQLAALSDFARRGFDVVIGHGGEFSEAGMEAAARFPNTKFVIASGKVTYRPNLATIRVDFYQIPFLAGVVAGMMTKTNKVAMICAQQFESVTAQVAGFTQGAKYVNPKVEVLVSYTGNWDDAGKAKEAALLELARGADVVTHVLNQGVDGVIEAVKEKKVWVIGQAADQYDLAPNLTLTSYVFHMPYVYLTLAKVVQAGKFEGKSYVIGLENPQAAGMGRWNPAVPQRVKDKVEEVRKLLIAGKIQRS